MYLIFKVKFSEKFEFTYIESDDERYVCRKVPIQIILEYIIIKQRMCMTLVVRDSIDVLVLSSYAMYAFECCSFSALEQNPTADTDRRVRSVMWPSTPIC